MKRTLLALLSLALICGCAHQSYKTSPPAYPPWIAKEPATWLEGGDIWRIDQRGTVLIGHYDFKKSVEELLK
jgi:hypothetical protein